MKQKLTKFAEELKKQAWQRKSVASIYKQFAVSYAECCKNSQVPS